MNTLRHLAAAAALAACGAAAQTPWLHIYQTEGFHSIKLEEANPIVHTLADDGELWLGFTADDGSPASVRAADVGECRVGVNIPTLYITTDDPTLDEVIDKETLLPATVTVDGNGFFDDGEFTEAAVKGRGNTTWHYPKKPYRLKFASKTRLLSFKKAKNYVLLANYLDFSLVRNAVALTCARLMGMPFTNSFEPVRLYFNGHCRGSYLLTEKIGINGSSVDIDENEGILFELDKNYDEDYKFRSAVYDLPVMVKDPDLAEIAALKGMEPEELLALWEADFKAMEQGVSDGDYSGVDLQSVVDFLIVNAFMGNADVSWPKSVYCYKGSLDGDVYHFGPVWDFDWCGLYRPSGETYTPEKIIFDTWSALLGTPFFRKLTQAPEFETLWAERWAYFESEVYPVVMDFIDSYADRIEASALENGVLWEPNPGVTLSTANFRENVALQTQWFRDRVAFIASHPRHSLFKE